MHDPVLLIGVERERGLGVGAEGGGVYGEHRHGNSGAHAAYLCSLQPSGYCLKQWGQTLCVHACQAGNKGGRRWMIIGQDCPTAMYLSVLCSPRKQQCEGLGQLQWQHAPSAAGEQRFERA